MERSVIFVWLKRAFCWHENWSDGDMSSARAPFGKSEYTCLNCGKKIFRAQNDPPVSRRVYPAEFSSRQRSERRNQEVLSIIDKECQ